MGEFRRDVNTLAQAIEVVALKILGQHPDIRLMYDGNPSSDPHVAVTIDTMDALTAGAIEGNPLEFAKVLATDLNLVLENKVPTWRGWVVLHEVKP